MDYENSDLQWPDGGRIYMDFRQVTIPKYSGTPIFEELPFYTDYVVNGGTGIEASYDTIDGGNGVDPITTFSGGNGLG